MMKGPRNALNFGKAVTFVLTVFSTICLADLTVYKDISQIAELSWEKCVVAIQNDNHNDGDGEVDLLGKQLADVFKAEPSVEIIQLRNNTSSSLEVITAYPKRYRDRSCLMGPPVVPPITGKPFQGPLTLPILVQFINENCHTFRSPSGSQTPPGILKEEILDNLYSLPRDQPPTVSRCDRIQASDLSWNEFFWKYLVKSRPVIIEGGAQNWTALSKWSSDYLRKKYHNKQVHVKLTEHGEFEGVEPAYLWPGYAEDRIPEIVRNQLPFPDLVVVRPATAEMKFSEFIDLIDAGLNKSGVSAYLEYSSIPYYMPELEQDILEPFTGQLLLERRHLNMWLSDGNTLGKLHFDPYDNFLCQLSGEKELVLFEPHKNKNLYEAHIPEALLGYNKKSRKFYRQSLLQSTSMVMSPVDILKPNTKRFPNFSKISRIECGIQSGDVLYMPAFWWHEVQSYPDSKEHRNLAVNFWYEPFLTKEFPCADCKMRFNDFYQNILLTPPN